MRAKIQYDLLLIDFLTLLLILGISFFPSNVLRVVLGVPFLLFFPGYALISVLFPRKSDLAGIERLALSLAMSIAVVPLTGFLLNFTTWGIRLYPILISVSGFTIIVSLLAWYRRTRVPAEERITFSFSLPRTPSFWKGKSLLTRTLYLILGASILATVAITVYAVMPRVGERFTEFYILGESGKVTDLPGELRLGAAGHIIIGIVNHEHSEVTYRIEVREAGTIIREVGQVILVHEQKWEQSVEFVPTIAGEKQKIEFLLFMGDGEEPYRTLHLFLNVSP